MTVLSKFNNRCKQYGLINFHNVRLAMQLSSGNFWRYSNASMKARLDWRAAVIAKRRGCRCAAAGQHRARWPPLPPPPPPLSDSPTRDELATRPSVRSGSSSQTSLIWSSRPCAKRKAGSLAESASYLRENTATWSEVKLKCLFRSG